MPDLNCPHCHFQLRVPESLMGKRLRCKNESCKRPFIAELQPASAPVSMDTGSFSDMPPELQQAADAQERDGFDDSSNSRFTEPASAGRIKRTSQAQQSNSNERYPNLIRYLGWARIVVTVLTAIAYFILASALIVGLIVVALNSSWLELIGAVFVSLIFAAFWGAIIYLYYVCSMAGIELIQVVIDIEENTRMQPALEGRT